MLVIDTGELTNEDVNQLGSDLLDYDPCVWAIRDYGYCCCLEFFNMKGDRSWSYAYQSAFLCIIDAKRMELEGVRGVV